MSQELTPELREFLGMPTEIEEESQRAEMNARLQARLDELTAPSRGEKLMSDLSSPDLTEATDAQVSAFLHVELFGVESVLPTSHGGYGQVVGVKLIDLDDLCTPSGALRVIEAMGEREWHTAYVYDYRAKRHEVKFIHGSDLAPQQTEPVTSAQYPEAVCRSAVLALLPAASEEGRRILNTP